MSIREQHTSAEQSDIGHWRLTARVGGQSVETTYSHASRAWLWEHRESVIRALIVPGFAIDSYVIEAI